MGKTKSNAKDNRAGDEVETNEIKNRKKRLCSTLKSSVMFNNIRTGNKKKNSEYKEIFQTAKHHQQNSTLTLHS